MSELDFSKTGALPAAAEAARPAASPVYSAAVAMDFFRGAGRPEETAAGTVLFAAGDKTSGLFSRNDKMYLLLEGEVDLRAGEQPLGSVKVGEIFGEMAALTHAPRSATASAKTKCRLLSLEGRQFEEGLGHKPEFALMLMSVMILRIRQTAAALRRRGARSDTDLARPASVFHRKLMTGLKNLLREREPLRYPAGQTIFREGDAGAFMYIVAAGTVAILVEGKPVERVGPGGTFGEMALVDQSPRSAAAQAETDCELMSLARSDFMALVKTSPAFGMALLKAMAERLVAMTSQLR